MYEHSSFGVVAPCCSRISTSASLLMFFGRFASNHLFELSSLMMFGSHWFFLINVYQRLLGLECQHYAHLTLRLTQRRFHLVLVPEWLFWACSSHPGVSLLHFLPALAAWVCSFFCSTFLFWGALCWKQFPSSDSSLSLCSVSRKARLPLQKNSVVAFALKICPFYIRYRPFCVSAPIWQGSPSICFLSWFCFESAWPPNSWLWSHHPNHLHFWKYDFDLSPPSNQCHAPLAWWAVHYCACCRTELSHFYLMNFFWDIGCFSEFVLLMLTALLCWISIEFVRIGFWTFGLCRHLLAWFDSWWQCKSSFVFEIVLALVAFSFSSICWPFHGILAHVSPMPSGSFFDSSMSISLAMVALVV